MFVSIICCLVCAVLSYTCGPEQENCQLPCRWEANCNCNSDGICPGCCMPPMCIDSNHNTAETCTGSGDGLDCVWIIEYERCEYASCGDVNHNTATTCTGSSVNGNDCVWNLDNLSCQSASCGDYNHNTQVKCTGSVNYQNCSWYPNNQTCGTVSCGDGNHNSQPKCTGSVNGNDCIWDGQSGICRSTYCGGYGHNNSGNCAGFVNGQDCIWNQNGGPSGNGYCQSTYCGGYGHNTSGNCVGFVSGSYCSWDDVDNLCSSIQCWVAEDNTACSSMPSVLECKWINRGAECQYCDDEAYDCKEMEDEEECKEEGAYCGCLWSGGKCVDSVGSGAFRVVVPTLLALILFVLFF